jgi:hypothetical protein
MTNLDNTGLGIPIDAIQPVVEMFALPQYGLSRADIWAFAATVAADVASNGTTPEPIDFTMNWVGRVDCENAHSVCYNSNGHAVSCSYKTGPARTTPSVTFNTQQTFGYFQQYFNFTPEDATAIMGFHTLGKLSKNVRFLRASLFNCVKRCIVWASITKPTLVACRILVSAAQMDGIILQPSCKTGTT